MSMYLNGYQSFIRDINIWVLTLALPEEKLRLISSLFKSYDIQHYTHNDKIEVNDPAKL